VDSTGFAAVPDLRADDDPDIDAFSSLEDMVLP
jgi:hypothetical protein